MKKDLLHIDFKGVLPGFSRMMDFPAFWADCGFTGVVLEFDARYPWQSWPGCWRGGLNRTQGRAFIDECRKQKLEVIPLIQIHGHLEWLLNIDRYAHLREDGFVNEICPNVPRIRRKMKNWIDEVTELFEGSSRIHLGGDEAWHIASCPKCRKIGKKALYVDYFSEMSGYAASKGFAPMIWGDFFSRENAWDTLQHFPADLQLVDWKYSPDCTFESTVEMMKNGRKVLGASGIGVCGGSNDLMYSAFSDRLENIRKWQEFASGHDIEIIHTVWGRDTSLGKLYANWFAAVPGFIAAGDPVRWAKHPWRETLEEISQAVAASSCDALPKAAESAAAMPWTNSIEKSAAEYISLAVEHQAWKCILQRQMFTRRYQEKLRDFNGLDEASYRSTCRYFAVLHKKFADWEKRYRKFCRENHLTDTDEFLEIYNGSWMEDLDKELQLNKEKGI